MININVSSQHNTGDANPYYYPDLIRYELATLAIHSIFVLGLSALGIGESYL